MPTARHPHRSGRRLPPERWCVWCASFVSLWPSGHSLPPFRTRAWAAPWIGGGKGMRSMHLANVQKYIEWRSLTHQISLQIFSCVYTCIWIYRIWYIIFRFHVSCILTYFKIYKHPWNRLWGDYPFRRLNATVQQAHLLPPKSQPWAMFVSCS